ncbi:hypothetical protein BOTBODRAFT_128393 [Botryobasidium botryosum FD-172 SS1]|uniref:PH domain-containing protein n=1 Tax=Botryobasidium botryosum (strain FD-172 SS1) TaxID=930990 RepID=A0A067MRW7_BOTB1|nr:hypothetical protein BOTBODRAFT_128393 [Botryobasidium botryosum FD-172 SS1]
MRASTTSTITMADGALFQVQLLAALRSGDPALIQPFLAKIALSKDNEGAAAALHLAIRCASRDTIAILLSNRFISPNTCHPPGSKTSPLHLAASLNRLDIIQLLLEQEDIDIAAHNSEGRSAAQVGGDQVKAAIQDARAALAQSYAALLRDYVASPLSAPPSVSLLAFLSSRRAQCVDLSALDPDTGTSLLHEAARRKDLRLIEMSARAGADVFVRDRRGKSVSETIKSDEKVKAFLRQFTNQDFSLIGPSSSEPPSLRGYLQKYANVAKGYGTRWFVLKDGMLSYYRNQDDENLACRGSLSMKTASLRISASDRLRFEVHSMPSRTSSTVQKWYMRASHPAEVARWTQAISRSIDLHQSGGSTQQPFDPGSTNSLRPSDSASTYASSTKLSREWTRGSTLVGRPRRSSPPIGRVEGENNAERLNERRYSPNQEGGSEHSASLHSSRESYSSENSTAPYQSTFALQGSSLQTQIDLTLQLVLTLSDPPKSSSRIQELQAALTSSVELLSSTFTEYKLMVSEREAWYEKQWKDEHAKSVMWEDSLGVVVGESEGLERQLAKLRNQTKVMRRASKLTAAAVPEIPPSAHNDIEAISNATTQEPSLSSTVISPLITVLPPASIANQVAMPSPLFPSSVRSTPALALEGDEEDSDSSTDEFFDAIDSNNLPNLIVPSFNTTPTSNNHGFLDPVQFKGYTQLRHKLPINNDDRPPVSLWAVLKGSIGKDLTKISFPVYFNEPTSMLQRMAEDMEFSECLDAAVQEDDPHRRIAFVAAFAMSNYSSTIGRIAKPFNPMLGETFEYCRLDKKYRYISEQVSHHPPISACWAESPLWYYYGEVDAKNKFMGKSFEIRPTGVAHVDLRLQKDRVPSELKYPVDTSSESNRIIEHYSWKKVTTNVSGFILGSPTIDHYGEMTVMNHRTGDKCVLTFKPRGWTAKNSCEITGNVIDSSGRTTWEIAGRWSSQLVARRVGTDQGDLLPDVTISGQQSSPEYILLWRNTDKPSMPFNLTPFAVSLNDCPQATLRPYLPPTDCRLRPDQRAFETGQYTRANELKSELEELQRATRRKREAGILPPHRPRWFEATTDADTGERVWAPVRIGEGGGLEYWEERKRVWENEGRQAWRNIEKIFVDE